MQGLNTYWQDGEIKVTLKEILDYLNNNNIPIKNINVCEIKKIIIDQRYDTKNSERTLSADLSYPIIVLKRNGKYKSILDGNHRAYKSIKLNKTHIQVREIDLSSPFTPLEYKHLFDYNIKTHYEENSNFFNS
jgi:DNA-binding transcriptional ArsR family regulator